MQFTLRHLAKYGRIRPKGKQRKLCAFSTANLKVVSFCHFCHHSAMMSYSYDDLLPSVNKSQLVSLSLFFC